MAEKEKVKKVIRKTTAQKRHAQSLRLNLVNRIRKSQIKTLRAKFDEKASVETMSNLVNSLDKAAKSNVIHKNKASRLKSKLARKLNAASKA